MCHIRPIRTRRVRAWPTPHHRRTITSRGHPIAKTRSTDRPLRAAFLRTTLAPALVIGTAVAAFSPAGPAQALGHHASADDVRDAQATGSAAPTRAPLSEIAALAQALRAAAQAAPAQHVVGAGDTVWAIAQRHGVRVADILAWNGLERGSIIYPGDVLALADPDGGAAPAAPSPAVPSPAVAAAPPTSAETTHAVRSGDTLWVIAESYGVRLDALIRANGLSAGSIIYPGEELRIPSSAPPSVPGLDDEQVQHAQLIVRVGRELGVSERGIAIALATAMVESWLRNLDWGDRDSAGLFQQRPSQGWGSSDEVQDAERAVRVFFGGDADPNGSRTRGLLDIPGWEDLAFAEAAQAVQISAYPDRYAEWEADAYAWIEALG